MSLLKRQEDLELTEGGILRPLVYLSLPIVISSFLLTAYNLADTFWIGQYSTEALAGISFGTPVIFMLISFGIGLSIAGTVLVAQHKGAGETAQAEYAASQTIIAGLLVSAVFGLTGYVVARPVLEILGASPEVLPGATAYLQVSALGVPFLFGLFTFMALMRGAGDTLTPMLVMLGTVVVNVVLDPFLINGWTVVENAPLVGTVGFPELGIEGAAIATVFSQGLATVIGMAIMLSGQYSIQIHLADMKPDLEYLQKILVIGGPVSIEGVGRWLSSNAVLLVVGLFSTSVVAAYGVGTRVFWVLFLPATAVSQGLETMTGQNIGAGKYDRAAEANYMAAKGLFVILALVGLVIFVAPSLIVDVFTDDPAVLEHGTTVLRYVALSFGFIGVMRALTGGLRGAGNTLAAAAITTMTLGGIRLPIAWVASNGVLPTDLWFLGDVDPRGIWLAFFISNVSGGVIAWLWFRRETWRRGDVRGASDQEGSESGEPDAAVSDD